jgi:ATP-dependent Zn protease
MSKRRVAILCVVLSGVLSLLWWAGAGQGSIPALTYSRFFEEVRTGQVAGAIIFGNNSGAIQATCTLKNGRTIRTVLPADYRDALRVMRDNLVNIEIRDASSGSLRILMNATPFLLLLGLWILLMFRGDHRWYSMR